MSHHVTILGAGLGAFVQDFWNLEFAFCCSLALKASIWLPGFWDLQPNYFHDTNVLDELLSGDFHFLDIVLLSITQRALAYRIYYHLPSTALSLCNVAHRRGGSTVSKQQVKRNHILLPSISTILPLSNTRFTSQPKFLPVTRSLTRLYPLHSLRHLQYLAKLES